MTLQQTIREKNQLVIGHQDYDNHIIAKFDMNFKLIGYYRNRNQAVIHHFRQKGFKNAKSIAFKYLAWNGALKQIMERGGSWQGHYYMYQPKHKVNLLYDGPTKFKPVPVVEVDKLGNEEEYKSITEYIHVTGKSGAFVYLDTGKNVPGTDSIIYRKGVTKEFDSKKDAMKFYRIGKDKFKKLMSNNLTIRGQKVKVK